MYPDLLLTAGGTQMHAEAAEAGAVVKRMLAANEAAARAIADRLRAEPPTMVLGVGRGSSDHAGVYAKYLIEQRIGIVTASAGLSLGSVYRRPLAVRGALCLAVSQSGRSPDLLAMVDVAKTSGARTLALVNDDRSPLAAAADDVLPLHAGPERSVAATKSFIASLAAVAQLVAYWSQDAALLAALDELPDTLERAWRQDWSMLVEGLGEAESLFMLGRGASYAIAREAALKLKETSAIHAEAYSSAEVLHGPAALAGAGYPILAFCQSDAGQPAMEETLATLAGRGARLFAAGAAGEGIIPLPTLDIHPLLQPIAMITSFYRAANAIAVGLGRDPDRPPHLSKVTETF